MNNTGTDMETTIDIEKRMEFWNEGAKIFGDQLLLNLARGRGGLNEDDHRDAETTEAYAFFDKLQAVVTKAAQ